MPLIKVAYFMLNFLNLKSFPSYLFFIVASSLSTLCIGMGGTCSKWRGKCSLFSTFSGCNDSKNLALYFSISWTSPTPRKFPKVSKNLSLCSLILDVSIIVFSSIWKNKKRIYCMGCTQILSNCRVHTFNVLHQ